jgi:hypothetical protein
MLATCMGIAGDDFDVVIKLNGALDFKTRGAVFELAASMMASTLGIDCPRPFLVSLSSEFVELVASKEPTRAPALRQSAGLNFGSEHFRDAAIWADGEPLGGSMVFDALQIFCFDGLIQNPDRSEGNPNLFTRGETLTAIDHEMAFSFIGSVLRSSSPWEMDGGDYMERHALRRSLRGKVLDWPAWRKALNKLDERFFDDLEECVPRAWNGTSDIAAIKEHVFKVRAHTDQFELALQRRLA